MLLLYDFGHWFASEGHIFFSFFQKKKKNPVSAHVVKELFLYSLPFLMFLIDRLHSFVTC